MTYREFAKEHLKAKNAEVGSQFVEIPKHQWAPIKHEPTNAWRNNRFMVQAFDEQGVVRLSINRTAVKGFRKDDSPIWADAITWDELQAIKHQLGYHDRWAVEIFPPDDQVINVANLRHLWLLPEPPVYGWHSHKNGGDRHE